MNIVITGVSSGIGRELTKKLLKQNHRVWGISRRKKLIQMLRDDMQGSNFLYTIADVSNKNFWNEFLQKAKSEKFRPDVIIFNAAIYENDLVDVIDINKLSYMMNVNFFSIVNGVKLLLEKYNKNLHFIAISSTSAFKGISAEGIGYAASKASLSIAFESLYQKYFNEKDIKFSTVYFGPVKTDMLRFGKYPPLTMKIEKAVNVIVKAVNEQKPFYYSPKGVFFALKIISLLPKPFASSLIKSLQHNYLKK